MDCTRSSGEVLIVSELWTPETTALTISGILTLLVGVILESRRRKESEASKTRQELATTQRQQLLNSITDVGAKLVDLAGRAEQHAIDDAARFQNHSTQLSTLHSRVAQLGQATKTTFSD